MKKYILTLTGTGLILCGALFADYRMNSDFAVVKTQSVQEQPVHQYITATGIVYEADRRELYLSFPFKIAKINVKTGDRVCVGDPLLYLDKQGFLNELKLAVLKGEAPSYSQEYQEMSDITAAVEETDEVLRSPIDGIVTSLSCKENARAGTELPVISISNMEELFVKTELPEKKASEIYAGQAVLLSVSGLKHTCEGRVASVSPTAKLSQTGGEATVEVHIKLHSTHESVKPGVSAELKFFIDSRPASIVIPFDSVLEDEEGNYVYLNQSGYAKKQYVLLGEELETLVEVIRGLQKEDKVILYPRRSELSHGKKIDEIAEDSNAAS